MVNIFREEVVMGERESFLSIKLLKLLYSFKQHLNQNLSESLLKKILDVHFAISNLSFPFMYIF